MDEFTERLFVLMKTYPERKKNNFQQYIENYVTTTGRGDIEFKITADPEDEVVILTTKEGYSFTIGDVRNYANGHGWNFEIKSNNYHVGGWWYKVVVCWK